MPLCTTSLCYHKSVFLRHLPLKDPLIFRLNKPSRNTFVKQLFLTPTIFLQHISKTKSAFRKDYWKKTQQHFSQETNTDHFKVKTDRLIDPTTLYSNQQEVVKTLHTTFSTPKPYRTTKLLKIPVSCLLIPKQLPLTLSPIAALFISHLKSNPVAQE